MSLAIFPADARDDILANCIGKHDDATFFLNAPTDVARLVAAVEAGLDFGPYLRHEYMSATETALAVGWDQAVNIIRAAIENALGEETSG